MGEKTKIEWCDHTWNPWFGCSKVSPACDFCYAEALMDTRYGKVSWGPGEDRKRTSPTNWREPLRWNKAASEAGRIETVFCLSLGDIWDNEVDPLWRSDAFGVMDATPNLLYLLLSKRIGNAVKMCDPMAGNRTLPRNAALGSTMVNQEEWDRDMPKLRHAAEVLGARFTFASVEPMLGEIDARGDLPDWVIVGGESGENARPMHPGWARSMRDQCAAAGKPFLFKQWGSCLPCSWDGEDERGRMAYIIDEEHSSVDYDDLGRARRVVAHGTEFAHFGHKNTGRRLDGAEHDGFPT